MEEGREGGRKGGREGGREGDVPSICLMRSMRAVRWRKASRVGEGKASRTWDRRRRRYWGREGGREGRGEKK